MKKVLYFVMSLMMLFSSCSNDSDTDDGTVKDGAYIYLNGSTAVDIVIRNGECYGLTIFLNNTVCFQAGAGFSGGGSFETSGTYPNFTYAYNPVYNRDEPWSLTVSFSGTSFQATPHGKLYKWYDSKETVELPNPMIFKKSDQILDINGDGILDSSQDL